MDITTKDAIDRIVSKKTVAGERFTAWEVTQTARSQGLFAQHNEVRDHVHDSFQRGQMGLAYTRTNVYIPASQASAWCYHLTADNPQNHPAVGVQTAPPATAPATIAIPTTTDDDDEDDDPPALPVSLRNPTRHLDRRNCLCVPAKMVKGLGLTTGDTAVIESDGNAGKIVAGSGGLGTYRVNGTYGFRVGGGVLKKLGFNGKTDYQFAVTNGAIKFSPTN